MGVLSGAVDLAFRVESEARRTAVRGLSRAYLAGLEAALTSRLAAESVDRVLASALVDRAARSTLDNAVIERVLEDGVVDRVVERLLESDELWQLVEAIAQSPAVTDAISQQGVGFADQVAGGVRARSRDADTWLEGKVRRALRREA
jgi:hypothetical protein